MRDLPDTAFALERSETGDLLIRKSSLGLQTSWSVPFTPVDCGALPSSIALLLLSGDPPPLADASPGPREDLGALEAELPDELVGARKAERATEPEASASPVANESDQLTFGLLVGPSFDFDGRLATAVSAQLTARIAPAMAIALVGRRDAGIQESGPFGSVGANVSLVAAALVGVLPMGPDSRLELLLGPAYASASVVGASRAPESLGAFALYGAARWSIALGGPLSGQVGLEATMADSLSFEGHDVPLSRVAGLVGVSIDLRRFF